MYRTVIAFVNNADFFVGGDDIVNHAIKLLLKYNRLNSATAGLGQYSKNAFHFWKTEFDENGNMVFWELLCKIAVDNMAITQLPYNNPVKSLGITSTPNMDWSHQFLVMKSKIEEAVIKMMATSL